MNSRKMLLTMTIPLLLMACTSSPQEYSASDKSVIVLPTKNSWEKPGATRDDVGIAQGECREELKRVPRYVSAVKDTGSAAIAKDRRRMISSMKISSSYFETCMLQKGFRHTSL